LKAALRAIRAMDEQSQPPNFWIHGAAILYVILSEKCIQKLIDLIESRDDNPGAAGSDARFAHPCREADHVVNPTRPSARAEGNSSGPPNAA
jgi:hypothetical protein